jgi:glycerol-3-phosphate responsive antiterminator
LRASFYGIRIANVSAVKFLFILKASLATGLLAATACGSEISSHLDAIPRVFLLDGLELQSARAQIREHDPRFSPALVKLELDTKNAL